MRDVREKAGVPNAEDFRAGGGTPIVVDTQGEVAYAINSAGSVFALTGAAGGGITAINVSAGTTSNNLSKLTFSNGSGVSFGLNGSVITATVATDYQPAGAYLTTAMASNRGSDFVQATAAFAGTNASGTIASAGVSVAVAAPFRNFFAIGNTIPGYSTSSTYSSGVFAAAGPISIGLFSDAGVVFAVNACGPGTSIATTAGTDLKATIDTNGLTIAHPAWLTTAQPVGAYLTTARASNDAIGLNTAATQVTWTVNSGGISLNAGAYLTTAQPPGAYLTTARASNDGVGLNTALTAGPLAWTVNSGGISLNAGSAAGTSTGFTGANISASITHNTAGIAISASVAAPGGGADKSASWHRINEMVTTAALWNNATFSNRPMFVPFKMQEAITAVNSVDIYVSRTGGTSVAATLHWGVYTLANATSMNLISSTSFKISLTTSAQFSGIRRLQFTGLGALSLSPGQYVMGLLASQAGTASWGMNAMGIGSAAIVGVIHPGTNSTAATATNTLAEPFMGVWNANSAALPSAVAASSVRGGLGGNNARVYAIIKAIT